MENRVSLLYFSATGNTKKSGQAIVRGLGCTSCTEIDVTAQRTDEIYEFAAGDVMVIGAPVYYGRIPEESMEKLRRIKGNGAYAVVYASFGNRDFDDALVELADMATERGFVVIGAGAFSGKHTFGSIAVNRPNAQDLAEAEALGSRVAQKLAGGETASITERISGNRPYKKASKMAVFPPSCSSACTGCGACVRACPTEAISKSDPTTTDAAKCMSCFACIKVCPVHARQPRGLKYRAVAMAMTRMLAKPQPNSLFV